MNSKNSSPKSTILSPGTHIQGEIFSEGALVLEGVVEGRIVCNRVNIKPAGAVLGSLNCTSLRIEKGGRVDGELQVMDQPITF